MYIGIYLCTYTRLVCICQTCVHLSNLHISDLCTYTVPDLCAYARPVQKSEIPDLFIYTRSAYIGRVKTGPLYTRLVDLFFYIANLFMYTRHIYVNQNCVPLFDLNKPGLKNKLKIFSLFCNTLRQANSRAKI